MTTGSSYSALKLPAPESRNASDLEHSSDALLSLRAIGGTKVVALLLAVFVAGSQPVAFQTLARMFEYDRSRPANERLSLREERSGVKIYDYSFDSPVAGRVPELLIVSQIPGRRPLILYGHWMLQDSPLRNKGEFLDEAVVMARSGAICLLLDSPLVREGVTEDPDPMHGQGPNAVLQMSKEWRRALDLLLTRPDVDSRRIAYVGHSFSAAVGAKLTGVEKRINSFVLMANQYSLREYIDDDQNADMIALRKKMGEDWINAYFAKFPWDDSLPFVQYSAPAAVFLQNGRADKSIPERIVKVSFGHFAEPKRLALYDAGHELNGAARMDRSQWLRERLSLTAPDTEALRNIPNLK